MGTPRKGRKVVRENATDQALRRDILAGMQRDNPKWTARQIAASMLANPATAYLLNRHPDPIKIVYNELEWLAKQREQAYAKIQPVHELTIYRGRLDGFIDVVWAKMNDPTLPPAVQARWGAIYLEAIQADARGGGLTVDKPAFVANLEAHLTLLGGGAPPGQENGHTPETIEGEIVASASMTALPGPTLSTFGLVDPYTFATHPDYCGLNVDDKPMQRIILQDFMREGSPYNELVAICGMRSGKGTIGSVIAWYKIYRLLEMQNPQRFYGLTPDQSIGTVNMALSEQQASANVFKHIKDRINFGGRWFQELRAWCELHIPNWSVELELRLPKNLYMRCGHSRARSLVGGTNIAVVFDELSKYKNTDGADNADQVYSQMKATTATFGDDALVVSIGSPEWEEDKGMQLLRQAMERNDSNIEDRCEECRIVAERPDYTPNPTKAHPKIFGIQLPTWEANLSLTYEGLWESQNGAARPRDFWRDFGAKPAEAQEGYYPDPSRWDRQADPLLIYPYDNLGRMRDEWQPCCPARRYVHVDLAVSRDACGVAMAHQPAPGCRWNKAVTTTAGREENPDGRKCVVDVCVQIKPKARPGQTNIEIDVEGVRSLIYAWQERGFKVKDGMVSFDGFQSAESLQALRKAGFRAELLSVDRDLKAHDTLQELINTEDIAYPAHSVLIREAKQLQLKRGRKVDHPPKGSKDVVDAVAGATYNAMTKGGWRGFIGGTQRRTPPPATN